MRLSVVRNVLPVILFIALSCDESTELFPWQCNCDIETIRLAQRSEVTYQVTAHDGGAVSSITYRTKDGVVSIDQPSLPFEATVSMDRGQQVELNVVGSPQKGNIVLTYQIRQGNDDAGALSSSISRVWAVRDGVCQ